MISTVVMRQYTNGRLTHPTLTHAPVSELLHFGSETWEQLRCFADMPQPPNPSANNEKESAGMGEVPTMAPCAPASSAPASSAGWAPGRSYFQRLKLILHSAPREQEGSAGGIWKKKSTRAAQPMSTPYIGLSQMAQSSTIC